MTSRAILCIRSSDIMVTTEHEIKPGQTNMTGLHRHTVKYSVVQYTERRLQCWNRSDASNKPTVGGGREGQNTVQTGGKGKDSGRSLEGGQGGGGQDTKYQATKRSELPHQ